MTVEALSLRELAGDELITELERRFVTTRVGVNLHGERGHLDVQILMPRSAEDLIREDEFEQDERLPYWADLWPSSHVLAERLIAFDGRGASALELGCGLGLASIAALRAGFSVTASDYYEEALAFTRANAMLNSSREPDTLLLDWRDVPGNVRTFDLVFAGDVLYERRYAALMADVLSRTLSPRGRALVADPGRVAAPEFLEACAPAGLSVTRESNYPLQIGEVTQTIRVYEIAGGAA